MIDTASDSRPSTAAFHLLVPYSFFLWCAGQRHDGGLENQGWGQIALGGCNTSRGATHVPPALLERPYLASVGACSRARVARRAACTFLLRAPHGRRVRRFCRAQQQVAAATAPRAPLRGEACATTSGGVCFSSWGRVARPCIVGPGAPRGAATTDVFFASGESCACCPAGAREHGWRGCVARRAAGHPAEPALGQGLGHARRGHRPDEPRGGPRQRRPGRSCWRRHEECPAGGRSGGGAHALGARKAAHRCGSLRGLTLAAAVEARQAHRRRRSHRRAGKQAPLKPRARVCPIPKACVDTDKGSGTSPARGARGGG